MSIVKVALLTAGGLAPCLSSAVGRLIERYNEVTEIEIIAYIGGYKGLLQGKLFLLTMILKIMRQFYMNMEEVRLVIVE